MANGKNDKLEPTQPITTFERRLLGIVAALVPTLFIALGAFIWSINIRVVTLEGTVKATESRTLDRYTKEDAHEDHKRVDKWHDETRKQIFALSMELHRLKGLHETHNNPLD